MLKFIDSNLGGLLSRLDNFTRFEKYGRYYFYIILALSQLIFYFLFKYFYSLSMGSDDSLTHFFYPQQVYENFALKHRLSYENTLQVFDFLSKLGAQAQDFYYLIFLLSVSFTFFFTKEIALIFKNRINYQDFTILYLMSVFYITNLSFVKDGWTGHYDSIFIFPIVPLFFLILIEIFNEKVNLIRIIFYNFILNVFSASIFAVHHIYLLILIVVLFSALIAIFRPNKLRYVIYKFFIFLIIYLSINLYWMLNYYQLWINALVNLKSLNMDSFILQSYWYNSKFFLDNFFLIKSLRESNFYAFVLLIFLGVSIVLFFFRIFWNNIKNPKTKYFFTIFFIIYLFALFLSTISYSALSAHTYVYLNQFFSFLTPFRNFENKSIQFFSIMSISLLLIIYYSKTSLNNLKKLIILLFCSSQVVLGSLNLFSISSDSKEFKITEFDSNYLEVVDFSRKHQEFIFVHLPHLDYGWIYLENANVGRYYGLNPLTHLSGAYRINNFGGLINLEPGAIYFKNFETLEDFKSKGISLEDLFFSSMKEQRASYLIVDTYEIFNTKNPFFENYNFFDYKKMLDILEKRYEKVFSSTDNKFLIYKLNSDLELLDENFNQNTTSASLTSSEILSKYRNSAEKIKIRLQTKDQTPFILKSYYANNKYFVPEPNSKIEKFEEEFDKYGNKYLKIFPKDANQEIEIYLVNQNLIIQRNLDLFSSLSMIIIIFLFFTLIHRKYFKYMKK